LSLCCFLLFISVAISIKSNDHRSFEKGENGLYSLFEAHLIQHSLSFTTEEKQKRFQIFKQNHAFVSSHSASTTGFSLSLNRFAHLTNEEYRSQFLTPLTVPEVEVDEKVSKDLCSKTLPPSVNYASRVTPVINQGLLGSSVVITTLTQISDIYNILASKPLPKLSSQSLLDCVPGQFPPINYYPWITKVGGVDSDASYPPSSGGQCKFSKKDVVVKLRWYQAIKQNNETDLACSVAEVGPTSVCIDASQTSFQFYTSGVYYDSACTTNIDHCLVAEGYGVTDQGVEYWLLKNSWGVNWGMNGYIMLAKNKGNACGVASYAAVAYPKLK